MRHFLVLGLICSAAWCFAQQGPPPSPFPPLTPHGRGNHQPGETPAEESMRHEREKALNKQRQEELKRDTDNLFKLAGELKDYVDKTDENMLSLDVIKKTEQIEKLAKSVREKMKATNLEPAAGSPSP